MLAQIFLRIPVNRIFGNFKLPLWIFFKKLKFLFLLNLYHFAEHYEARKTKEPI